MAGMRVPRRLRSVSLLITLSVALTTVVTVVAESPAAAANGSIAGRVINEQGSPIPFARVEAITSSSSHELVATTYTGIDGTYRFAGLPDQSYFVRFVGPVGSPPQYVPEYWADNNGEPINVLGFGATSATGIDATMVLASTISGRVTDTAGRPIPEMDVFSYYKSEAGWSGGTYPQGTTDVNGNYTLILRPGATYRVKVDNPDLDFAPEFWPDAISVLEAQDVALATKGAHVSGIDVSLTRASHITGVVLPETFVRWYGGPSVRVDLKRGNTWFSTHGFAEDDGRYDVGGLHAGTYRVEYYFPGGSIKGYLSEWFGETPNAWEATEIVVPTATTVGGINARLGSHFGVVAALPPALKGKAIVGRTLRVTHGTWRPVDVQLRYEWLAKGRTVHRGGRLELTRKLLGDRLLVEITAAHVGFAPATVRIRVPGRVRPRG